MKHSVKRMLWNMKCYKDKTHQYEYQHAFLDGSFLEIPSRNHHIHIWTSWWDQAYALACDGNWGGEVFWISLCSPLHHMHSWPLVGGHIDGCSSFALSWMTLNIQDKDSPQWHEIACDSANAGQCRKHACTEYIKNPWFVCRYDKSQHGTSGCASHHI